MIEIKLTQGKKTIIDDIDDDLNTWKWHTAKHGRYNIMFYAVRNSPWVNGKRNKIYIHQIIMEKMLKRPLAKGEKVDHIDHDGLRNTRDNLRLATKQENGFNRQINKTPNKTSKYKGVCWHKRDQKWEAYICIDGNPNHIGYFNTEIDAALAYDKVAIHLHGGYMCLNFPNLA